MLADLSFSFRQLVKSPGFTLVAALTLALGIGANTAIFSLINALLLKPLPYPEPDQLVQVAQDFGRGTNATNPYSGGLYLDLAERSTQFSHLAYFKNSSLDLAGHEEPVRLNGLDVSANYLQTFGIKPALGADFTADNETPGGNKRVVILSDSAWRAHFAADPAVVSRSVTLDYQSYTIVGVLAPHAILGPEIDYLAPGAIRIDEWKQTRRYDYVVNLVGRLKPGATIESARSELETIKANSIDEYPDVMKEWGVSVISLHEATYGSYRPYTLTLLAAVGLVLLVACANVANLLFARANARQGEIAVRSSLGAPAWKIARQLLCESAMLSLLGGLIGLVLGIASLKPLALVVGLNELPNVSLAIDPLVLLFTLCISLVTGLFFGAFPAAKAIRIGVVSSLRDSTRSATSAKGQKVQAALIVSEIAMTVVLLVSIGLLLQSFRNAFSADPGFNQENVLTFEITRSAQKAPTESDYVRFTEHVIERLQQIPGVQTAAMVSSIPMNGSQFFGGPLWRDDQPDSANQYFVGFDAIFGEYFETMGIPLLAGRNFNAADQVPGAPKVLIVNEQVAKDLFPDSDPLGQIVRDDTAAWEIVGVVGTINPYNLTAPPRGLTYRPMAQWPWHTGYVVKTSLPPLALADQARAAVQEVDPQQPINRLRTLESAVRETVSGRLIMLSLVGIFGLIAVFLAAIGIYGLMSFLVQQRQREIGIRLAIGALPAEIVRMVLGRGLLLASIGCLIGIGLVLLLGRYLAFLLYQVEPYDPAIIAVVTALTLAIAAFASWRPALRASKTSPSEALQLA